MSNTTAGMHDVTVKSLPVIMTNNTPLQNNIFDKEQPDMKKILVMDDDIMVRFVIQRLLEKYGCETICTTNGEETLEVYKNDYDKKPFSLVLMDLTINNGLGGIETVKLLKEFDPDAKVAVFSGHSFDPICTEYRKYGFDAILNKPITNRELTSVMMELLGDTENKNVKAL